MNIISETTLGELKEIIPKGAGLMLIHHSGVFQCTLYLRNSRENFTADAPTIPEALDAAVKGFKDQGLKEGG